MKIAVSNTGPLVHLTQVEQLSLLFETFDNIIIPQSVHDEAIEAGLRQGYPDAIVLDHEVKCGRILVESVQGKPTFDFTSSGIHKGEVEVIQLAMSRNTNVVLLDDGGARLLARTLGLQVKGSLGIVISAAREGLLTKREARIIIAKLNGIMYLSSDVYDLALRELDE